MSLDFSDPRARVQIVYGPNEAGKTTIKSAIEELLFGFLVRTPYDFLHGYATLRLDGAIENAAGDQLRFTRIKKRLNDLRSASGDPLPNDALAPYLRGITRDAFCMQFSLSRESMIQGSKEIEEGRGDVGESLYNAALGNASLPQIIKRLDERIAEIFTAQARNRKLNKAISAFEVARTTLIRSLVKPQAWDEQVHKHDAIAKRFAEVDAGLASFAQTVGLCERLRAQAQAYDRLVILRNALAARAGDAGLAEETIVAAEALLDELQKARAAVDTADEQITELTEGHEPKDDSPLLAQATAIRALIERVGDYQTKARDLRRLDLRGNARRNSDEANRKLVRVWPNVDLDTARGRSIPQTTIARGSALVLEHTRRSTEIVTASAAVAELAESMATIAAELTPLPLADDLTALRAAVAAASAEGRLDQAIARAEFQESRQRREANEKLSALGLFTGDLAALASVVLPLRERIETYKRDFERLDCEKALLEQRQTAAQSRRDDALQQLQRVAKEGNLHTLGDLEESRQERDGFFEELAQAWHTDASPGDLDAAGALYRPTVCAADDVADDLRRNSDRVATVTQLRSAQETAEREITSIDGRTSKNVEQAVALAGSWTAVWASLGIAPLAPTEMLAWLQQALTLRKNREDLEREAAELNEKRATRTNLVTGLNESIKVTGRDALVGERLEPLLARAKDIVAQIDEAEANRKKLQADLARDQRQIGRQRKAEADGMAALAQLQIAWFGILDATWLSHEAEPADFNEMIALIEQFRTADTKARNDQERADGIEQDNAAFRADVVAFVSAHAPDLEALADKAPDAVTTSLADRLAQAQSAHDRRAEREEVLGRARLTRDAARSRAERFNDEILALATSAGVERDAIGRIVPRSKETLKMRKNLDGLQEDVETGTGLSLDACDAEYQGRTRAELDSDLLVAQENERSLVAERDEVFAEKREIEAALAALDSSEAALNAQADMMAIGAEIDQEARQWAELSLARFVLDQQIRDYADKNQGALIARSSEYFQRLTAGGYLKLRAVTDESKNYLEAVDQTGHGTRVDGLSEGTRDQLYFALRLAALEHHFKDNEPQPVILDDAFVAFDDRRSGLAFDVLADFAKTTQVIYFTHHRACADAALTAIPPEMVTLHELPPRWANAPTAKAADLVGVPALRDVAASAHDNPAAA